MSNKKNVFDIQQLSNQRSTTSALTSEDRFKQLDAFSNRKSFRSPGQERAEQKLKEVNEILEERVKERTQSLLAYQAQLRRLASKLSRAEEQERHRLAAELHDNLGQMLAVNKMKMDMLPLDQLPEQVASAIEEVKEGLDQALIYTRNLMSDLKPPPSLDKEDIRSTIVWLVQKMEKHDLEVIIDDDGYQKRTTKEIQTTLLQCVRELLFNIIKHTREQSASIRMRRAGSRVRITVEDTGKGFDPESEAVVPSDDGGFGLFNIRERMDLMGGSIDIDSRPGKGTKVILTAPVKEVTEPRWPGASLA